MSFNFRVKFADGEGTVTDVTGTPPEAPLSVNVSGHSDQQWVSISAALIDSDSGAQVIGASATGKAS